MDGFNQQPLMAELPLDGQEAFRLASFGIEYVPSYAPVTFDRDCAASCKFTISPVTLAAFEFIEDYRAKWGFL